MAIDNYSIGGYWLLFYWGYWLLLIVILLVTIGGYFIDVY